MLGSYRSVSVGVVFALVVVSCGGSDDGSEDPLVKGGTGGGGTGASDGGVSTGGAQTGGTAGSGGGGGGGGAGTGGVGTGGTSSSTGGSPSFSPCINSLDCIDDPEGRTICNQTLGVCVECAAPTDCSVPANCVQNTCIPYTPCVNSLDCATQQQVCDVARGRCVDCVGTNDCDAATEVCVNSLCQAACDSDNDCTPFGKLCDFATGGCTECLSDVDCAPEEYCDAGQCHADVCAADSSFCGPNGVVTCSSRGDALLPPAPCDARTSCVEGPGGAACEPWVCTPGATECTDATTAVTCSADGFSILSSTDCSVTNQFCNAGACSDLACQPNSDFCDQGSRRHCAADGLSSTLVQACEASEFCDMADPSCKPLLCMPSAPACDGNVATVCNTTGTGYTNGGTDCGSTAQTCVSGTCQSCSPGGPLDAVRLVEVFIGQADYVVLENTSSTCPVDLAGLTLTAADTDAAVDLSIASFSLAPGARALVGEAGTTTGADTTTDALIDLNATAGNVLLCAGPCTTTGTPTVIDAMSYWDGATAPPALPSPVTFSPIPVVANMNTDAFVRTAFTGSYPNFQPSDWSTGSATRPDTMTGTCPATQPVTGGICLTYIGPCTYGAVTCSCAVYWTCS